MSWNIGENKYPQIATFWKVMKDHDTWAEVSLSTSKRDKEKNWHNSNWSYCRFVANAYKNLGELNEKDRIVIKAGQIEREAYIDKNGEKVFPKNEKITIFAWEKYVPENQEDVAPPMIEDEEDDEEIPF